MPLLTRMMRVPRLNNRIWSGDAWILTHFPGIAHFATVHAMSLRSLSGDGVSAAVSGTSPVGNAPHSRMIVLSPFVPCNPFETVNIVP